MKFPNPFENFRRKKMDIDDVEKPENKREKPSVKPSGFFKKTRLRRAAVAALTEKFHDIQKTSDPGERLLQYKKLREDCIRTLEEATGKTILPAVGTGVGGFTMIVGGVAMLNAPLFLAGIFAMGTGAGMLASGAKPKKMIISPSLAKDCKALVEIALKTETVMEAIVYMEDLSAIARSPHVHELQVTFPELKARFQEAAEKDPSLKKPQPPAQDNPAEPKL